MYITPIEAQQRYGYHPKTLSRWALDGKIKSIKSQEWVHPNPNCKCISDYGSGLNFKRQKFVSLMEQVLKQEIKTIVVAHKDRLCRFGYYLVNGFVMPIDVTLLFLTIPTNHRTKN